MSNKLTKEDIEEINNCFIEFQRQDDFLPIKDDWEPNQYGLKLYQIEEKLNHRRYQLEDMDNFNT